MRFVCFFIENPFKFNIFKPLKLNLRCEKSSYFTTFIPFVGKSRFNTTKFIRLKLVCTLLTAAFLLLTGHQATGQSSAGMAKKYNKALLAYRAGDFITARNELAKITTVFPGHLEACLLMADICHDQGLTGEELSWLEKSSGIPGAPALVRYRAADACFRLGKYGEGLNHINRLEGESLPASLRGKADKLSNHLRFAAEAIKKPVPFNPVPLDSLINTGFDEYWPSLSLDGHLLVFTRLVPVAGHAFLRQEDFYYAESDSCGWKKALPVAVINSPLNEGAQALSADGKLLFFTLCNHPAGNGSCDIWFSRFENGNWTPPGNAGDPVNTPGWEGQPSFTAFGNILYFSSSRPGGKGNKDLWSAHLKEWDASGYPVWERLTRLDDSINTSGDEISPFIHPNGKDLYFSSDSRPGFGGLDLFHAEKKPDGSWSTPSNMGYPLNSLGNEQGLIIDRTGRTAYFATNRSVEKDMDIYRFDTSDHFRPDPVTYVRGKITNAVTDAPVPAKIRVRASQTEQPIDFEVKADADGVFLITLPPQQEVLFTVNEKGFLFYSEKIDLSVSSSELAPLERKVKLWPAEPGSMISLYNIFFDTGEYAILPESEPELGTLVEFLRQNPGLSVEIGGHTDNVGSIPFNQVLSEKRARSVKDYLVENDIPSPGISVRGYGMEIPVASNETEEGRSKNRRTTMKITGNF